jgi:DNA-binding MarR family transcriptional regulator
MDATTIDPVNDGGAAPKGSAEAFVGSDLMDRPGFLIRRLHQIHLSFFAEECAGFDTTPLQSSVLIVALKKPRLEQARLAEAVGVDRATLAEVLARLEDRGLVSRTSSPGDRRLKRVSVTKAGADLARAMAEATARAHARVLAPLPESERAAFMARLRDLVDANNAIRRAPLR